MLELRPNLEKLHFCQIENTLFSWHENVNFEFLSHKKFIISLAWESETLHYFFINYLPLGLNFWKFITRTHFCSERLCYWQLIQAIPNLVSKQPLSWNLKSGKCFTISSKKCRIWLIMVSDERLDWFDLIFLSLLFIYLF